ncbi:MAG: hypothetical protein IPN72_03125 [Saprospiraceae bacterium]|nr:hypothetical protein [Saprospiraceae bacterium]
MKHLLFASIFHLLFSFSYLNAQDESPEVPGDHFSLEGSLDLFQKSSSLEEFEQKLNARDNKVNNLDLNEDGQVDYVSVRDEVDGDIHAIVLHVDINEQESHAVAVIEVEKSDDEVVFYKWLAMMTFMGKVTLLNLGMESLVLMMTNMMKPLL